MPRDKKERAEDARSASDKNINQPWVSNYPPLAAWKKEHGAIGLKQTRMINGAYLEHWVLNGHVLLVEVRPNQLGWEIYTALPSNDIQACLADALIRCSKP